MKRSTDFTIHPKQYAFIKFPTHQWAKRAFNFFSNGQLPVISVDGKDHILRIGYAKSSCTLHVTNLDECVTEDILSSLFSRFGDLEKDGVVVETGNFERHGQLHSFRFASIQFLNAESAEKAMIAMDGTVIGGKACHVIINKKKNNRWRGDKYCAVTTRNSRTHPEKNIETETVSLYIQFYTVDETAGHMSEEFLRGIFASYEPLSITLKTSHFRGHHNFGYGFIDFENSFAGIERAREVAYTFGSDGKIYDGVLLKVEFSKNLMKVLKSMDDDWKSRPDLHHLPPPPPPLTTASFPSLPPYELHECIQSSLWSPSLEPLYYHHTHTHHPQVLPPPSPHLYPHTHPILHSPMYSFSSPHHRRFGNTFLPQRGH